MSTHFANRNVGNVHKGIRVKGSTITDHGSDIVETRPDIQISPLLIEAFVSKYLQSGFDGALPTPQFHREMWALCASKEIKVAFAAPRGHAKSTCITHAYTLTASLFRQRDFILILSDTWGQSVEFLRDIKDELLTNDDIIKDFEVEKFLKDAEDDVIVKMRDGYKFRIVARGAEQKVRGLKWKGKRPNLILFDDVEGDEQVESKPRRDKFFKWMMKAVLPCGSDDCLYRWVGTILHFDSALERILKDKTWVTRRYAAHKSFEDFSEILWPEKFPEARLRAKREEYVIQGESDGYSQEYLNYPIASTTAYFNPDYLIPMTDDDRQKRMVYYAGWDMAVSQEQKTDWTVCVVIGVCPEGYLHVVDVRRAKMDSLGIVEEIFSINKAYNPFHVMETGQISHAIMPFLNTEILKRQAFIHMTHLVSSKDKEIRAKPMQGKLKTRHIKFDKETTWWAEFEEEIRRFPKGGKDDQVDAFSIIGRGMEMILPANSDSEQEDEEYFLKFGSTAETGQNATTGY